MPNALSRCARRGALAVAVTALASAALPASAVAIYGVTSDNKLFTLDSETPQTITSSLAISGFGAINEKIEAIDFRPSNAQLYAIGSFGQLYTVNTVTAALTPVGAPHPINGTSFGFDFDPTNDTVRLMSDTERNYIINPNTGVQTLGPLITHDPASALAALDPNIVGLGFTNGPIGGNPPANTTLFGIDVFLLNNNGGAQGDVRLVTVDPDTGVVKPTPLSFTRDNLQFGFDILNVGQPANVGFLSLVAGNQSRLSQINIENRQFIGSEKIIGGGLIVTDIAVVPEPAGAALIAVAAGAMLGRRTRRSGHAAS
jgi:hypothetical protein